MCALNPTLHYRVTLDFYTSQKVDKDAFVEKIIGKVLEAEMDINEDGSIRCHASNPTQVTLGCRETYPTAWD